MTSGINNRLTGARKFEPHPEEVDRDRVDLEAAGNRPSRLMRDVDETIEKTRQSDAVDQPPAKKDANRVRSGGGPDRSPAKPE